MDPDASWSDWARERQRHVERALDQGLPPIAPPAPRLAEAMRHAALGGGKRVRPLLAYASGELTGADEAILDSVAVAVELIHAYSLVHDDLPCMDDDALRRGKPTCHVAYGEATALLAGDALQALAFEVLAAGRIPEPGRACALLARAAGHAGMAGGQAVDLASVGCTLALDELETMHRLKTGALIAAAVQLGAMAGRPLSHDEAAALDAYAMAAGLAFQVVDDVLDVQEPSTTLGKTAGKDAAQHKPTYVALLGLDEARAFAERLREQARAALRPFGARGRRLVELADWIVDRRY